MTMTSKTYPLPAGACLVESMEREFGPLLQKKNLKKIGIWSKFKIKRKIKNEI